MLIKTLFYRELKTEGRYSILVSFRTYAFPLKVPLIRGLNTTKYSHCEATRAFRVDSCDLHS